ncbi:fibronectin type III domain-containing protein [Zunongwangia profunda]|uniref:fibronectin type III domain-containing protein n=1 Tax=Zunongwangia profunda TaxID=398743 RepID=UPI001D187075|nr:fibronectin type III domain-containing protein [Zunongwangia profunda]MCC4228379.1 fibronectin type III domain-containing protein [Zunongwangia profunda]
MANAKRPSVNLTEKRNVNPSVNRQTEVTAEDFQEIAALLNDHAELIDAANLNPEKFYKFHTSLATLSAAHPNAEENGWAVIIPANGNAQFVATFENGQWIASENTAPVQLFNNIADRPDEGQEGIFYIVKDEKIIYLWYNNKWNGFGKDGNNGLSAYQVAVARGFVGSEDEWLESLRGKSAYQIAQDNGFQGTEAEWLQSLVGPPGDGSGTSNNNRGDFTGELDVSGGNNFYNDYLGDALDISISNNKSLGSTATVRIQGGKLNLIPASWNFSGEIISDNEIYFNELTVLYVRYNDIRIVNRVVPIPDDEDPTPASNLIASNISGSVFTLSWDAGGDNIAVDRYEVFLDGNIAKTTTQLTTSITDLDELTSYSVFVRTYDTSGNYADSNPINVETSQSDPVDVPFTWVGLVNAFDLGDGTIQFDIDNGFSGNRNGGISDKLINGDVIVDFLPLKNAGVQIFGIGSDDFTIADDSSTNLANLEVAFVSKPDGTWQILENGTNILNNQSGFGSSAVCQLIISGNSMSFALDDAIVYTSQKLPDFPMSVVQLFNQTQGAGETQAFYRTTTNLIE